VSIGMVLATAAILLLGWEVRRVLTWIVVAALLSVVLGPVVDLAEHRLRLRRALATLLVFLLFLVALAGIVTVFVRPLATEGPQFIDRLPGYVEDARAGRGAIGGLIQRYNLDQYLERNQSRLQESTNRITEPALGVLRSIFSTVVALVTIFVLTFLMVLQGPKLLQSWIAALPEDRQERVRRVAADCSKAVTCSSRSSCPAPCSCRHSRSPSHPARRRAAGLPGGAAGHPSRRHPARHRPRPL
jgi:predicted PurR-regulated permease PerM